MNSREIKLADKCRDFNWIKEQYESGRLYLNGSGFTQSLFDQFRLFVKCTEEVHEGKWDLDITSGSGGVSIRGIIIYFEKFDLINSSGNTTPIEQLFVKVELHVRNSRINVLDLYGGRTKISYAEWCSNYFHSHLSRGYDPDDNSIPYYGSFCRGSGHINEHIAEINADIITRELLIKFLVQIIGVVTYESIEGGPHKLMSDIITSPSSGRRFSVNEHDFNSIYTKIINWYRENETIPNIDFKLENEQYILIENEKLDNFLLNTISLDRTEKKRILCIMDSNGIAYEVGQLPGYTPPPIPSSVYIFQGQRYPMIIGNPPTSVQEDDNGEIIHPEIKRFLKTKIQNDINKNKVRESTIQRYTNKSSDARENIASDQVAV